MEVLGCQLAKSRLRCLILTRKKHMKFNASVILMLKNLLKFRKLTPPLFLSMMLLNIKSTLTCRSMASFRTSMN